MYMCVCVWLCCDQFLFVTSHNSERAIPFKLKPFIALLPTSNIIVWSFNYAPLLTFHFM